MRRPIRREIDASDWVYVSLAMDRVVVLLCGGEAGMAKGEAGGHNVDIAANGPGTRWPFGCVNRVPIFL